ncbi:hypothetical protein PENTCL1PPCAC_16506 [Pristionchus entomophagus]|uniref:Uncharacterized protein n=1 Tax=Pristionchus entomophagus TaxID=358040 RepID=A0AAV5TJ68_9BILA|nr:hypothetical protein PENTCL1PPCAC_16506 [Pristionchus entomophagus]
MDRDEDSSDNLDRKQQPFRRICIVVQLDKCDHGESFIGDPDQLFASVVFLITEGENILLELSQNIVTSKECGGVRTGLELSFAQIIFILLGKRQLSSILGHPGRLLLSADAVECQQSIEWIQIY